MTSSELSEIRQHIIAVLDAGNTDTVRGRLQAASTLDFTESVGFLLRQLGFHSTMRFAEQLATIQLTPPHAGILRAIAAEPGRSQQALSAYLGLVPGRLVGYLDELEERRYIERRRNSGDRRWNAIHLTAEGKKLMRKISCFARQHEDQLTAGLDPEKCRALRNLLATVAQQQGLTPQVHPGYHAPDRWVPQPLRTSPPATSNGSSSPRVRAYSAGTGPSGRGRHPRWGTAQ
jgi:DNA-binding MarR family transcriptional regulator